VGVVGEEVMRVVIVVIVGTEVELVVHLHFWLELLGGEAFLTLGGHRPGQLVGELRQKQ
jgi:hypothetical protein